MKRKFAAFLIVALLVAILPAFAQRPAPFVPNANYEHYQAGIYFAQSYATYSARILNTLTGTGSQTYIVGPPTPLADGTSFAYNPAILFNTNTPLLFSDASSEIVTPTAVSIGNCPTSVTTGGPSGGAVCVSITASFSNTHGQGSLVVSGDSGIQEAMTDAGNNGGGLVYFQTDVPATTLNTGGLTTTTTYYAPKQFMSFGATAKVTTTITTSANWAVGISGTTAAFCTANSTLTAGTTCTANQNAPAQVGSGTAQGVTAILFTMGTSNAGAGAIKARVWGYAPVQATN